MKVIEGREGEYSGYYIAECDEERIIVAVAKFLGIEYRHECWEPSFPAGFSLPGTPFVVQPKIGRTFEITFRGAPGPFGPCGYNSCCQRKVKISEVIRVEELHNTGQG